MAGLKGKFIAYTNSSGSDKTMLITGASKFKLVSTGTLDVYTESQTEVNAQTISANVELREDCMSKQNNTDVFEDIYVVVADGVKVDGYVFGQGASWSVS